MPSNILKVTEGFNTLLYIFIRNRQIGGAYLLDLPSGGSEAVLDLVGLQGQNDASGQGIVGKVGLRDGLHARPLGFQGLMSVGLLLGGDTVELLLIAMTSLWRPGVVGTIPVLQFSLVMWQGNKPQIYTTVQKFGVTYKCPFCKFAQKKSGHFLSIKITSYSSEIQCRYC